jgi:membrane dipeptidase
MLIVDGHLHLAVNALQKSRNMLFSALTIRSQEVRTAILPTAGKGTVALPEMRQGHIALCFDAVVGNCTDSPSPGRSYASPTQAYGVARGQMAYHRALEKEGHARVVTDLETLNSHMAEWEAWDASENPNPDDAPPLGIVVAMEGADPVLAPDELSEWWDLGLRVITVSHHGRGRYAGGTGTEYGLTELGPPLLAEMEQLGVLLDLVHLTDQAFWQVLEHYNGPLMASHTNVRSLVPHQRQMSDEQIKAIVERNGVIGATGASCWMLKPGWIFGRDTNEDVSLDAIADHLDYVCQLAGDSEHAAVASDLDGGYGRDESPRDLETIADLQKLGSLLAARGYREADVANIMHGNWLRLLRQSWGG